METPPIVGGSYKSPVLGTQGHKARRDASTYLQHEALVYTVSSNRPVSASHSGIWTRDVRINTLPRHSRSDILTTTPRGEHNEKR